MTEQLTEQPVETTAAPAAPGPVRVPWAMVPRVNLLPMEMQEARSRDDDGFRPLAEGGLVRAFKICGFPHLERLELDSQRVCRAPRFTVLGIGMIRIP